MALELVKKVSSAILFLVSTPIGYIIDGSLLILLLVFVLARALHRERLLALAAGTKFGPAQKLFVCTEALGRLFASLAANLPVLLIAAVLSVSVVAIGETIRKVEASIEAASRIKELQTVLRNLERSLKIAEIRVLSTQNDRTTFEITYFDPENQNSIAETRTISIDGRDIYIDAIVLNFDYSEIAAGRRVNIAIPYRVFSDQVPQINGISLGGIDSKGIPYMFHRADEDIYGIAPEVYRERLKELVQLISSDTSARPAGIVRSLYGSALHKRVNTGDRYELRVEQTGGLTLRERFPF
ncbi:hypothetical protein [Gracilinema caldarium]|uniref:Uncharacterized protein n=1 Tax=Gracilinema caldarium (strain ATCC 51460 / DSM 7334 / H1) TaxID=744872 RepID=F8EXP1_GRAC1|nr:hypothetical protein [Gracilinema caldarium]AEJ19622.1 hypothetical protein Spica_1478 [Gracilinema caldarium DSM 7334]